MVFSPAPHSRFRAFLRLLVVVIATVGVLAFSVRSVDASVYSGNGLSLTPVNGVSTNTNIVNLIVFLIEFLLNFVLIIAVLAVVIAGFYLITSGGDEGQKDKAKNIIFYAGIGIIVIGLARVIVLFANSLF